MRTTIYLANALQENGFMRIEQFHMQGAFPSESGSTVSTAERQSTNQEGSPKTTILTLEENLVCTFTEFHFWMNVYLYHFQKIPNTVLNVIKIFFKNYSPCQSLNTVESCAVEF